MRASSGVISDRIRANAGWVSSIEVDVVGRGACSLRAAALQFGDGRARRGTPSGTPFGSDASSAYPSARHAAARRSGAASCRIAARLAVHRARAT